MAVIKCKMCGGDLILTEGQSVAECEYCGSRQTVPAADNEKKLTLFARANRLRSSCDFDKAAGIYESIVADFPEEAEAYWGLVLCKYGIEYVDDPATGKKIPTCHRSSFDSVMDDGNFDQAMENADEVALRIYRQEAKQIEQIRKGILEVSSNEQPYDIFICYKETDSNGDRTVDSLLAQDIYDALTAKGYRVFFSRITLEDKLGQAYEPYIFAALNSAKIMLAVGTCYEHYNAVWVKNEWSRYLKIVAQDKNKYLIPCYKNIDAYDIPKEFAHLQGQDMGKVGAIADLLRGVQKLLRKQEQTAKETVVGQQGGNPTADSYLERAFLFLEDEDWSSADQYCEKVLDIEPRNHRAYLGKLMAQLRVKHQEDLRKCAAPFSQNANYAKVLRFCDEDTRRMLEEALACIIQRLEQEKKEQQLRELERKRQEMEQEAQRRRALLAKLAAIREKIRPIQVCLAAGNSFTMGLKVNGTVLATVYKGTNYVGECNVRGWRDIEAVSAGDKHTVGLKADGTVVAVGKNKDGQCNVSSWQDIVAISAGSSHTVGLKADGTVVATQYRGLPSFNKGQCDVIGWRNIIAISAGSSHTIGLKADGTVTAIGYNYAGQCDVSGWRDIITIAAGVGHTVGLKANGTLVAVGANKDGRCNISDWTNIVAIAAGAYHTVGLKADGTVVAVGDNDKGQCNVSGWREIVAISAGSSHTVGLKADGTVVAVGENKNGQCDVSGMKLFASIDSISKESAAAQKKWKEEQERRNAGLCQYCGGELKGLFTKKCTICGKPKDY